MRSLLRALGFAGAWVACAALAQPTTEGVDECAAAIERQRYEQDAEEYLRAGETCPALTAAIAGSVWNEALLGSSAEDLSAQALVSLAELALAYEATTNASGIGVDSLDAVLASIREPDIAVEISLWSRFMSWLRELLGFGREGGSNWLAEWLQSIAIPGQVALAIVIAIGIGLLLVTIGIIVNELKEAGVLGRRAAKAALPEGAAFADDAPRVSSIDDVRRAPLARQPGLLLMLIVDALRRYVPIAPSTTHRDLMTATSALRATQREPYARVVTSAERATFGGWTPAPDDLEPLLASGESLLASLTTTPDGDTVPPTDGAKGVP